MEQALSPDFPARALRRFMHRIELPRDIDAVTAIDRANECDPADAGIGRRGAQAIWDAVRGLYRTGYYPAVMFCLRRDGRIVFNRAIGHARGNAPDDDPNGEHVPVRVDTPSCLFSASKAMSAMLLHRMDEHHEINLLDPISLYIPEFAQQGKERTTIHQLLAHRAGIPGIADVTDPRAILDHETSLRRLCEAAPRQLLGRRQAYHAVTGGVILAEIVRRVSGMSVRQAWRKWFKQPLGLKVLDYGADARTRARMATQTLTGIQGCALIDGFMRKALGAPLAEIVPLVNHADFLEAVIPSANMVGTAEEVSAFYQMLLDEGRWQGRRLLRPETVHRATLEAGPHVFDATIGFPLRFSTGFMLGGSPFGIYGARSHHAFGHVGLVNNIAWADPERRVSAALLVSGMPLLAPNVGALARLITTIAACCPRVPA